VIVHVTGSHRATPRRLASPRSRRPLAALRAPWPHAGLRAPWLAALSSALLLVAVDAAFALADAPARDSLDLEPPPEAKEGADYEIERADSLSEASVEVGFSASGRAGERPRAGRRVRYRDDAMSAQMREGAGDPLAGATLDARAAAGVWRIGRLAPRWGRGLLLGAAGAPWSRAALDRGEDARFRGRSGDGVSYRHGGAIGVDALGGRFAKHDLVGLRMSLGGASAGLIASGGNGLQASMALERQGGEGEIAFERSGRWRLETAAGRGIGRAVLSAQARGGSEGFRSLAEPERAGPARAAAVSVDAPVGGAALRAIGALWQFRPGLNGARAALEVGMRFAQHGVLELGVEEQQGVRRIPSARQAKGLPGTRHGAWCQWRGGPRGFAVALRHEAWGEERLARRAVRVVSAARVDARGPFGLTLGMAHTVFHARSGESLYLAEAEADRLVLRALAGDGERTRLEARAPLGGGALRASLDLATAGSKAPRPRWTLDWSRRARAKSPGAARGP
jgi:hypothetical protein